MPEGEVRIPVGLDTAAAKDALAKLKDAFADVKSGIAGGMKASLATLATAAIAQTSQHIGTGFTAGAAALGRLYIPQSLQRVGDPMNAWEQARQETLQQIGPYGQNLGREQILRIQQARFNLLSAQQKTEIWANRVMDEAWWAGKDVEQVAAEERAGTNRTRDNRDLLQRVADVLDDIYGAMKSQPSQSLGR